MFKLLCSHTEFDFETQVSTDIEGKGNWKRCFKVDGVILPTGYYVEASSATGDLFDFHDIFSIKFYELDVPEKASAVANDIVLISY